MPGDHDKIIKENDDFLKESYISFFKLQEHHNPLDIPFGHEVHEVNMEIDNDTDEGGLGSGRNPEGGDTGASSQQGPLISFGLNETIKTLMDAKLNDCSCHKKNS